LRAGCILQTGLDLLLIQFEETLTDKLQAGSCLLIKIWEFSIKSFDMGAIL
jgi:hypothetical protein